MYSVVEKEQALREKQGEVFNKFDFSVSFKGSSQGNAMGPIWTFIVLTFIYKKIFNSGRFNGGPLFKCVTMDHILQLDIYFI